jgi:hypothetical protein
MKETSRQFSWLTLALGITVGLIVAPRSAVSERGPTEWTKPRINARLGELHLTFWPKDTYGCGEATFEVRVKTGSVSLIPSKTYWDVSMDPTSRLKLARKSAEFSFGEDSCKILMWIDTGRIQTEPDVKAE